MAPFKKPSRGSVISKGRFSLDRDGADPLVGYLAPEADESADSRVKRLAREEEERRVSDEIDKQLELEAKEKRRLAKSVNELQILLLGPTGAGKTTFLRQMRMQYDTKGLDAEREAHRLVILLNVIQTVRTLLSLLDSDTAAQCATPPSSDPDNLFRPLSAGGREGGHPLSSGPRNQAEANYRRRVRLAPLLGLEAQLRESLGVIASGPSAPSLLAHSVTGDGIKKLGWRDAAPTLNNGNAPTSAYANGGSGPVDGDSVISAEGAIMVNGASQRRHQVRSRAGSPGGQESEPIFAPGFAEKIGAFAFGSGKESRRARAQGTKTESTTSPDGQFLAGPDDPIHLLAALKEEILALWQETIDRGLIAGEGTRGNKSKAVLHFMQSQFELCHQDRKKLVPKVNANSDAYELATQYRPLYCYATQANDTKSVRFVIAAINDVLMRGTLAASGLL
ncbi:hypothetical protein P7C70_g5868, partial [Phenoliferia sp. Uapishka_3]